MLTTNQQWLHRWSRTPEEAASLHWEQYSEAVYERFSQCRLPRFSRQFDLLLQQETGVLHSTSEPRRQKERESLLWQIVFRSFEEVFLEEGRQRIHWRNFPTDSNEWRDRANAVGLSFLLAREHLSSESSEHTAVQRTCQAIELAEAWESNEELPDDVSLEALSLVVWFRRGLDVTRQMVRVEHAKPVETIPLEDWNGQTESTEWSPSSPSRPESRFFEAEGLQLLQRIVLGVCKDETDRSLFRLKEEEMVRSEIAKFLGLSQGQVRGRWNTLTDRARLFFQVVTSQQNRSLSTPYPRREQELASRLRLQLQNILSHPSNQSISIDFWLLYYQLSVILLHRIEQSPDQKGQWNALSQTWRRSVVELMQRDAKLGQDTLLRDLVFFWLETAPSTMESSTQSTTTASVSLQRTDSQEP